MSISPVSRVQAGVPTGGQFASTTHAEPRLTLVPSTPPGAVAYTDDLSVLDTDTAELVESWQSRLQDAGISGQLSNAERDGGELRADLTLPDGRKFGFQVGGQGIDVWRDGVDVDDAHRGVSDLWQPASAAGGPTSEDLATAFSQSHAKAVTADEWAAWSTVRSGEKVSFDLPEINRHGDGEMKIGLADGSNWRVVVPRGSDKARVFDNDDYEMGSRMTQALLEDAAEAAGEKPDSEAVIYSMTRSLTPTVGGTW